MLEANVHRRRGAVPPARMVPNVATPLGLKAAKFGLLHPRIRCDRPAEVVEHVAAGVAQS